MQRLRCQHECLNVLLEVPDRQILVKRPAPEKWHIVDQVAHLVAYQHVFAGRIHEILCQDNPAFPRYVGDNDPLFLERRNESPDDLLVDLSADRQYLYEWICSLEPDQLRRTATHPVYGERSLLLWSEFFLLHEAHHCFTIFKLSSL